uniref:Uncharacterized protein n=1 Tax=Ditylenchus dipsaci TaxID=166011 RepID=A0A915D2T8_9BILA
MSWKETDPLSLWKNSTVVPRPSVQDAHIEKTELAKRLDGSRSKLWVQLSQMTPQHREEYLSKLVRNWPYKWEKRAVLHPASVSMAVSALSASFVATKVCADVILYEPKQKLIAAIRQSPKKPIMFAAWTSALTSIMLNQSMNYQPILTKEGKPCEPCVFGKSIAFGLFSGIMLPVLSVPYAVEYVVNSIFYFLLHLKNVCQ